MPRDNNDYASRYARARKVYRPTDRHGNGRFTVHGIDRVIGGTPSRRGGYQGPDTRGQISRSLGWSGGGTTGMQTKRW